MNTKSTTTDDCIDAPHYQIRLQSHLDVGWADWFEGMTITLETDGTTLLSGPVPDQAALHGLFRKIRNLGLPLISVICVNHASNTADKGEHDMNNVQRLGSPAAPMKETSERKPLMKAIVFTEYGPPDNLHLREIPQPTPKADDILIKVHAVALNAADARALRANSLFLRFMFGLFKPKRQTPGVDVAGRVEAVGKHVTQFKVGDEVFGDLSGAGFGGLAEYVCAAESILALKPANLSFAEAAAAPMASVTALQGLRAGNIQAGQKVLVYGASGGVGSFAVQIAKVLGAEVTAVCSPSKIEWARSLGADHVLDYTRDDITQSGPHYDLILAANGNRSLSDFEPALTPTGTFVIAGGAISQIFKTMFLAPFKSKKGGRTFRHIAAQPNQADLNTIKGWMESGRVKPAVDKQYALSDTPSAMRYLEAGHARGKVVITVV